MVPVRVAPFLPPELVALLLGMALIAGVALMIGMRIAWRRDVEPLSRAARLAFVVFAVIAIGGGWAVYALADRYFSR